jgi:hypothetical protein
MKASGKTTRRAPASPGFGDQLTGFGERSIAVEEHGRGLNCGYLEGRHDRPLLPVLKLLFLHRYDDTWLVAVHP